MGVVRPRHQVGGGGGPGPTEPSGGLTRPTPISGGSLIQAAAASKPSKPVLQAAGVQWLTAPLVMALHTKQGKMKPEMAIANGALCASMGGLCFLAANKCDD